MKKNNLVLISNIICTLLILVLAAMQFLPFWSCTGCKNHEDGMISISDYLWQTKNHTPVTNKMTEVYQNHYGGNLKDENGKKWKFEANDVVTIPLVAVITGIIAFVGLVLKPKKILSTFAAFVGGAVGVFGYLTNLALQAGQNWVLHLVVAIAVTVVSSVFLAITTYKFVRKYI